MRNRQEKRVANPERGVAAVEFAILAPIMLMLLLATAEFGRALYEYNTLAKAVRDGVRYYASNAIEGTTGVIPTSDPYAIQTQQATRNLIVYGNTAGTGTPVLNQFTVTQITFPTPPEPLDVVVRAQYPYQPIFSYLPTFGLGSAISTNFTFSVVETMRAL